MKVRHISFPLPWCVLHIVSKAPMSTPLTSVEQAHQNHDQWIAVPSGAMPIHDDDNGDNSIEFKTITLVLLRCWRMCVVSVSQGETYAVFSDAKNLKDVFGLIAINNKTEVWYKPGFFQALSPVLRCFQNCNVLCSAGFHFVETYR